MKDYLKDIGKKIGFAGVALLGSLGLEGRVNGEAISPSYRADNPDKILALAGYDSMQTGPNFDNLYGNVLFSDTNPVPTGYRLWFLKKSNGAVAGVFNTTNSDPEGFFKIYGETGVNNSLVSGNELSLVAQKLSDNSFYEANFNSPPITFQDKQGAPALEADITVTNTQIPAPLSIALLASGAASFGIAYGLRLLKKRK